ncbi:hypothetical protein [Nostoc sp.]|uniref:hypothetical protein n=1 Tax=Nostoc sp. TaxID=1180 RepID=UPI002FFCCBDD
MSFIINNFGSNEYQGDKRSLPLINGSQDSPASVEFVRAIAALTSDPVELIRQDADNSPVTG